MENTTEQKTNTLSKIKDHWLKTALLNDIEGKPNYGRDSGRIWRQAENQLREGKIKSIFELLKITDTPENRFKIISSQVRLLEASMPWLFDKKIDMPEDNASVVPINIHFTNFIVRLDNMLNGTESPKFEDGKTRVMWYKKMYDPKHLVKHIIRSGVQSSMVLERVNPIKATAQNTSKTELKWSIPAAWLHDIARLISQGSDHDVWGERLFEETNIRTEIVEAKHEAVPIDGGVNGFDAQHFDTPTQKIVRISDVGGKVDFETGELRDSVYKLQTFSKEVQLQYLEAGDAMWTGFENPQEAIDNYTKKEAKCLEASIEFMKSIGVNWFDVVQTINKDWRKTGSILAQVAI